MGLPQIASFFALVVGPAEGSTAAIWIVAEYFHVHGWLLFLAIVFGALLGVPLGYAEGVAALKLFER